MSKTSRLEVGRPWNSCPYHEATPVSTPGSAVGGSREQPPSPRARTAPMTAAEAPRRVLRDPAARAPRWSGKGCREPLLEIRERLARRRHDAEEAQVVGADRALLDHGIELDQVPPVVAPVEDEGHFLLRD